MEALPDANIKIACLDPEATQVVIPFRKGSDTASLRDNPTTRALLERLPMTVTMGELNGNEKYFFQGGKSACQHPAARTDPHQRSDALRL